MTLHAFYLNDPKSFLPHTLRIEPTSFAGIQLQKGSRAGSATIEAIAYTFDADLFTAEAARQWLDDRAIKLADVKADDETVNFWFEACKAGEFDAENDGTGKPGKVRITLERLQKAAESVKKNAGRALNKLTHDARQTAARELFGAAGMGKILDARVTGETLELFTAMPKAVASMVKNRILTGRSIELHPVSSDLMGCAWLGTTDPAVPGLAPVQLSGASDVLRGDFLPPALLDDDGNLLLLTAAPTQSGGPSAEDGTAVPTSGNAGDPPSQPNSDPSQENDMSAELQAQLAAAQEQNKAIQLGRIRADVTRAVNEKRIKPGDAESWTARLSKQIAMPEVLDASLEMLAALPVTEDRTKSKGNPNPPDVTGADGTGDDAETENLSAVDRVMLAANDLMAKAPASVLTNGEPDAEKALLLVLTRNPKLRDEYEKETHRFRNDVEDEGGES